MKMRLILLILILFATSVASGQKEGNIWYFGSRAGISFNSGVPQALTNSSLSTYEGCASIADADGNLLFYTDGTSVWNRNHEKMPNGTGLKGNSSSTSSAIIVPYPGQSKLYYIFTVDDQAGSDGLCHSLVDMSLDNGMGDLPPNRKNQELHNPVVEKLTAVLHRNGRDIWVISHTYGDNTFLAWLITDNGLQTIPVKSASGSSHAGNLVNTIGYLKAASGGTKLACAVSNTPGFVEVFSFDNETGEVSDPVNIPNLDKPYGVEFSQDNSKLYVSCINSQKIWQYDMNLPSQDIPASGVEIASCQKAPAALQLAPDRRIYVALQGSPSLGIIHRPDQKGTGCKYEDAIFDLAGRTSNSGLPTFIQSFFISQTDFSYDHSCYGAPVHFKGISNITPDSWWWNFGDPQSDAKNISNLQNPEHIFSAPGTYTVTMAISYKGESDTIVKIINVDPKPVVYLGEDRTYCTGQPLMLDAGNPGMKYLWSTGDTSRKLQVDSSATYWVRVSSGSCEVTDTVDITFVPVEALKLGSDTLVCKGTRLALGNVVKGARVKWSTGDTTARITVTETGAYWRQADLGNCVYSDTVIVFFTEPLKVDIGRDTLLCEGDTVTLDAGNRGATYLWSTGETTQKVSVTNGGDYWVAVKAGPCITIDSIHISRCRAIVFAPNAITPNGDNLNDWFMITTRDVVKGHLKIANRWGNTVYETEDLNAPWKGDFNGEPAPAGRYVWTVIYWESVDDILYSRELSGDLYLLR